ncbi:MAG: DUF3800 domain-containing protein [Mycobacteriaceae bacterium]|nr:DUF3800 domain-containing protein [Mycobacteriaceae bacterium]
MATSGTGGEGVADPIEIACDESGAEGENLIEGSARVFSLGSTDLTIREADELMHRLRAETGFGGRELKSSTLLKPRHLAATLELFSPGGALDGRAKVFLVDKAYMAVCKIVDLVIEEHAYRMGLRLHVTGDARRIARELFQEGPRAFRTNDWNRLLREFVSFARSTQRKGTKTTHDDLLKTIDELRLRARRQRVLTTMQLLWEGREQLKVLSSEGTGGGLRTLDPLIPSVFETARTWHELTGSPIRLIHDRQSVLTDEARTSLREVGNNPHPEFPIPVPIRGIDLRDSRDDPRIQVADIIAGVGSLAGQSALTGTLDEEVAAAIRAVIAAQSLWGDNTTWYLLSGG